LTEQDILLDAQKLGIASRNIDDLAFVWSKNETLAENIWHCCIGQFNKMKTWEIQYQKQTMQQLNLKYLEDSNEPLVATQKKKDKTIVQKKTEMRGGKGCIAKLATLVKRDILRVINKAAKDTHKKLIVPKKRMGATKLTDSGSKVYARAKSKQVEFDAAVHLGEVIEILDDSSEVR
jgi:hypothetical protein